MLRPVLCCSRRGMLRAVRAEAEGGRVPAQQQDRSAVHEGGQELPPGRGALQEGAGPGAAHRERVRRWRGCQSSLLARVLGREV